MISVTILTKNSEKYLSAVLESVKSFEEVVVYDTGSSDKTLEIAQTFPNVRIQQDDFYGFGPTHNLASSVAKNDWILSIDSDEIVTPALVEEIRCLELNPKYVYSFPRHNYYKKKWIRWCGWYPDRQIRLYNRTQTQFSDAHVHESIDTEGMKHKHLGAPIIHYSYNSISDFLNKMQHYSDLYVSQNIGKKKSTPLKAVSHGLYAFFKSYVLQRGFMGGYEGLLISAYNGQTAFYKYIKLYEANQENKER